jgi:aminomethyltransferase
MSDLDFDHLARTPLYALHQELGARLVPFAGYAMPVQYPAGLIAEHRHTRAAAGLFDVSHMGQIRIAAPDPADAARALERLLPVDVLGLAPQRQRYGLLPNEAGGILDDLMMVNRDDHFFLIVNGACKAADLAHIQARIGACCTITPLPEQALLALQGPQAVQALSRLVPGVERLVLMTGGDFAWQNVPVYVTRSG